MTLLTRWTPLHDRLAIRPLREMTNLMDDLLQSSFSGSSAAGYPPVDVSETGEAYTVTIEIPGMRKEDIQLSVHENSLALSFTKPQAQVEEDGRRYIQVERFHGTFERQFRFATSIDSSRVKATYKDGVLEVVLPKAESARTRSVEIEVK